jgi:outer membrane murein-binding lipoprotein Lpp
MTKQRLTRFTLTATAALLVAGCSSLGLGGNPMSFFITSTNPGKGADFGGVAGADQHCQRLATAAGAGNKTWRAYVSTTGAGGVNARDRIGSGPWKNAKGEVVATNVDDLHSANNKLGKQTSLTEKGAVVNGRGDTPNMHDILTGSTPDGRASTSTNDTTCRNWTSSTTGSVLMGHHDRDGINPDPVANKSWNSSHGSRGCDTASLAATGSAGLLYCFATN